MHITGSYYMEIYIKEEIRSAAVGLRDFCRYYSDKTKKNLTAAKIQGHN
jgi:hypothetical protein